MLFPEPTQKAALLSLAQARWRLMAGPPAVFQEDQFGVQQPVAGYLQRGAGWPPCKDVLKLVRVEPTQILWLRAESRRLGVSQRRLLRQAVDRFQSGPPAKLPSDRRSLWRRKDWRYKVTASHSLEREWERYRARQATHEGGRVLPPVG